MYKSIKTAIKPLFKDEEVYKKVKAAIKEVVAKDPSRQAPKEWWAKLTKRIKKSNPSYSDEIVRKTAGKIWRDLSEKKKKTIRERFGKKLSPKKAKASMTQEDLDQTLADLTGELIDAITNDEFTVVKTINDLHPKRTVITFSHEEEGEGLETYLRGNSTNPKVGSDIWQINWVCENLENGKLDCTTNKQQILELYDKYIDVENESIESTEAQTELSYGYEVHQKTAEDTGDMETGPLVQEGMDYLDSFATLEEAKEHILKGLKPPADNYVILKDNKAWEYNVASKTWKEEAVGTKAKAQTETKPWKFFLLQDINKEIEEDTYKDGIIGKRQSILTDTINKKFATAKEMIDWISKNYGLHEGFGNFVAFDNGRIISSQLENEKGEQMSKSEQEKWEKGEIKGFAADYDIYFSVIDEHTPTVEEMEKMGFERE